MRGTITPDLISNLGNVDLVVFDAKQRGLQLRLRASGVHTWRVQVGRGEFRTLGRTDVLTPAGARVAAHNELTAETARRARDAAAGLDPEAEARKRRAERKQKRAGDNKPWTFDRFLTERYEPWGETHFKSTASTLGALKLQFSPLLGSRLLPDIDPFTIESWRSKRLKAGTSVATVNKDLSALKAMLNRAVSWKLLPANPLRDVKPTKQDRQGVVRFLTPAEEAALRKALTARDDKRRAARDSANEFRRARGYRELVPFGTYTDHMTPVVLLALNTGLRRGELLGLKWSDVDLVGAMLSVRGEVAKSGKTRHVPLNAEAVAVLKDWQPDATGDLVFPGEDGDAMFSLKTSWGKIIKAAAKTTASIADFRFHDLRHTFASKLVQRGVDLVVVRELLGHSDFNLTLRYSHLAAENKVEAVAKLGGAK